MKRGLVIGLARSGVAAANLLVRRGWDITVTDMKQAEELEGFISALEPHVHQALGGHRDNLLDGIELVVVSPGVPLNIELIEKAKDKGIEIIGELELAYRYFKDNNYYCITGTNGKSTTVTLLHMMMVSDGRKSLLAGNIGVPLCQVLDDGTSYDCVVVEASSFQLDTIKDFHPRGSVVLNVTPDHLDRYDSIEAYGDSKLRCAMNHDGNDFLVLNADDCMLNGEVLTDSKVYYFSSKKRDDGISMDGSKIVYNFNDDLRGELADIKEITIQGAHNLENAMAASAVALLSGCSVAAVRTALQEFVGLEHRLEFVRELDGVKYINDSKGTNVGAVIKSLESAGAPVVLIAGGRDKDGDFGALTEPIKNNARAVILIGEAADKIERAISDAGKPCHIVQSMTDAVRLSHELAEEGDIVLLSPACASFDMFASFEHRGEQFKQEVVRL